MNNVTRMLCIGLVLSFLGSAACVADAAPWFVWGQTKTQEEKAREAEKLEDQREAAAMAKRQAKAKAKAAREGKAQLAKLNAEAEKQAKAEIAEAKSQKKAKLAEVGAKAKEQAEEIKAEKAALNSGLKQAKAEAKSEHKQQLAEAEEEGRDELEAQYKQQVAQLESEYKEALDQVNNKAAIQSAEIELEKEQIEADYQQELAKTNLKLRNRKNELSLEQVVLPEDSTPRLKVKELRISGNTLVPTAELLEGMPLIYNASNEPLLQADSEFLYDFKILQDIILMPGQSREVSTRTIQGLTQYILSIYQEYNYAGIYVYVPTEALKDGAVLQDDVLPVNILEATVTKVSVRSLDPDLNEKGEGEKIYLRPSAVEKWSPVKEGEVTNKKKLNDFVNLLNLNPDRYVSAVISKGTEPKSLAVEYDIYEANPWHYFIQADNSGTKTRQWTPRVGLINTNLLGIDDTLTAMYQAPWENGIEDNYAVYGSYDFPLLGPRLRLNLFGGYSQFDDMSGDAGFNFIGNGHFYGGTLRLNVLQENDWFFDVTGTLMHERSKITSLALPQFSIGSDVEMDMWGWGIDIHHRDDMSNTSLKFERLDSFSGSSAARFEQARPGAERNFNILTTSATHSQYLDPDKVQRASGSFRWITSDERLVPAKMTVFGGMYTVRGYDEYEIIADGGILASAQYEFDFVKYGEAREGTENQSEQLQERTEKPLLRKLAPLAFFDYGLAKVEDPVVGDQEDQELCSVGSGVIVEIGDNYSGVVYYGYPLIPTGSTRTGKGRLHIGFLARW